MSVHWDWRRTPFREIWPLKLSHFFFHQRSTKAKQIKQLISNALHTKWNTKRAIERNKKKSNKIPCRNKLPINNLVFFFLLWYRIERKGIQFLYLFKLVLEVCWRHPKKQVTYNLHITNGRLTSRKKRVKWTTFTFF